ncbi:hypothetical protein [Pedobacter borealis]|uniref:hypothetical protein n=1 Tax=Pedobacter borealis TaxID=475254 RepID=UPI000493178A|nr:hypothetical protein [Pedobacter borealis]
MERQLPLVDIAGTAFYVDVLHDELRQKDNQKNRISFNVFDQDGDGYTFLYDTAIKNVPGPAEELTHMKESYQWVTLKALMELDPRGIALKYKIPLSILCPELVEEDEENEDDYEEESFYR